MKNNKKVNIFGIFCNNHKIDLLSDKCAKNHLKIISFDIWNKLVKFMKKMKTSDKKYKVLVPRELEPVTLLSHLKTLPTEPRAQCDMHMHQMNKIWKLKRNLKNGAKPLFFFNNNQFAKSKLTCSFLDEIKRCKHVFCSIFNKE